MSLDKSFLFFVFYFLFCRVRMDLAPPSPFRICTGYIYAIGGGGEINSAWFAKKACCDLQSPVLRPPIIPDVGPFSAIFGRVGEGKRVKN